jgi:ligand-binding sensor domain-containing protein/tRNA A-37 threonylcarbamoyl transferase component Bud32
MANVKTVLLVLAALCGGGYFNLHLLSLDPQKQIPQYIHKKWTSGDGLPESNISDILQTNDGYLWIGTGAGLVRFDGVKFEVFDKSHTPGIPDNRITVLYETGDRTLWAGTRNGLIMYKNGEFKFLAAGTGTRENELLHPVVQALQEDSQGNLWIGYQGNGISMYKKGDFSSLYHPAEFSQIKVIHDFCLDNRGNLWIGTLHGLLRLKKGKLENIPAKTKEGKPIQGILTLIPDREGNICFGTFSDGLIWYRDKTFTAYTQQNGLRSNWIHAVFIDRDGILWAGAEAGGLHRRVDNNLSVFSEQDGLSNDSVNCIHEDREGNLWVGTYSGLNLFIDGKFTTYTEKEGLMDNVTWTVYEDRQRNLWITTNNGLNCFRNGQFTAFSKQDGLSSDFVSCTWEDQYGNLWIGTYDEGLNRLTNGVFTPMGKKHGMDSRSIRAVYEDSKGNLWVGTYGRGLFKKAKGSRTFTSFSTQNRLSSTYVFIIYEDHSGGLWIGTDGGGLNHLEDEHISFYTKKNGLSSNSIFSIIEDRERPGTLWIGTEDNGLNVFNHGKIVPITVENGLIDSTVYQIIEDDNGFFWMSGIKGISWVSKHVLYDFVEGKITRITASLFGNADGMKANECNGGFQPAGCRTNDGKIWFPTTKGIVSVNPNNNKINTVAPPVLVEKVVVDGKPARGGSISPLPLTLGPGTKKVVIHYTALSLSEPRRVKFRYILEGFETEWVTSGERKDRIAIYTNIPPGKYTFRVTACNNDGIWNKEGALLNITVRSPFWQKWWFILLTVMAFSMLSYLALSSLKKLVKMIDFWRKKNYIGKYRIITQIGSGGMANIFKAVSRKGTKKEVLALKLMKDEFMFDAVYRRRFLDESEIIDSMNHPHIVKVLERGEHHHSLFIAMEYLEGETLDRVITQKSPLPPGESLDIVLQILDALSEIHRAGIVHRDLKPGNIMLIKKENKENFVKILDFGLAKTQSVSRVTESGMVVGTLNYLSPEQLLNSRYSSASDIYALGVIFYEMLTGEKPYKGETPIEIMQAIFKTRVNAPKFINKDIPAKLNTIIIDMIDKKAENRPPAEALKITLQKLFNASGGQPF